MTLHESTSNNVVFVFGVFVSLSVSKFMCDVFYVEFYFENVWYRSFLFVRERCLVSSYLLILVLFKRSLFCINALLGASWQMHTDFMSCVWYVGLYVTKYVLLIVVTKCVLLKRLKILILSTGRIDKCAHRLF